ncbi:MAG: peptidase M20, partial [Candidatus Hermodarchaeota archaeon]
LIQNKCVNPPGNELRSIKSIEEFLTKKGIECQVFESTSNRGNLVTRIKGIKDGAPRLMFGPSHVDVVPVPNPEAWEVDPFSGAVKDGYIWG